MSGENCGDSSTSESEIEACSSTFNPHKVLYSKQTKVPVESAPIYENIDQFEAALKYDTVIPVGHSEAVRKREEEKEKKKREEEQRLEERNKARFAQYQGNYFEVMFLCQ